MTETEKFVKLILPYLVIFVKEQEKKETMQKGLDNFKNPSIYCILKGANNA